MFTLTAAGMGTLPASATVGELIDILSQYDEDQPVYIRNDNGYTYGSVQMDSVTEGEEDEDE